MTITAQQEETSQTSNTILLEHLFEAECIWHTSQMLQLLCSRQVVTVNLHCRDLTCWLQLTTHCWLCFTTGSQQQDISSHTWAAVRSVAFITSIGCHSPFVRRDCRINRSSGVRALHGGTMKGRSIVVRYERSIAVPKTSFHAKLRRSLRPCLHFLHSPPQLEVLHTVRTPLHMPYMLGAITTQSCAFASAHRNLQEATLSA